MLQSWGGVIINDGAVIAANATVAKDVPPYAIVGGVPASIIRYRFCDKIVKDLIDIKWWNWNIDKIKEESKFFDNVDLFIKRNRI